MSSPSHAASRATARTRSMVLRVSQPALHGSSVRSLSKKLACANSLATDSLSPPSQRAPHHVWATISPGS
jgi:hypothetical protein